VKSNGSSDLDPLAERDAKPDKAIMSSS
jgi:hypothetical protein